MKQRHAEERRQRETERAARAAVASAELEAARTPSEVRDAVNAHDPQLFSVTATLTAWTVIVESHALIPTHDLVYWKSRSREWEFYFRWLPDVVVREVRREPLWRTPSEEAWCTADGSKYRPIESEHVRAAPFGLGVRHPMVLPHGAPFALGTRRLSPSSRPSYWLSNGQPVESRGTNPPYTSLNGEDLAGLLPT